MMTHQGMSLLRSDHQDRLLIKKDYRREDYHILHTTRNFMLCKTLLITVMFLPILNYQHATLDKRYCKDGLYKSQPILTSEDCRCRKPVGNYRKYSLWLRIRDHRDGEQIVNCSQWCQ